MQFCVFDDVLYSIGFFVGADTVAIVKHRKRVFYHEDDDSDIACEAAIFVMALKPLEDRNSSIIIAIKPSCCLTALYKLACACPSWTFNHRAKAARWIEACS